MTENTEENRAKVQAEKDDKKERKFALLSCFLFRGIGFRMREKERRKEKEREKLTVIIRLALAFRSSTCHCS